jgi:GH18 family chitinase
MLNSLVTSSHNAGVRVLLSIGGWNDGDDSAFNSLAATPEGRARFATALDGYVDQFQLDGIDIDWEFPEADQAVNFTAMIREVSAKLRPKNKLLTIAVAAFAGGGAGVTPESLQYIDLVNIMAYDGQNGPGHSPMSYAEDALALWLGKGVPREKAILGVPFYSRPGYVPYSALLAQSPQASTLDNLGAEYYNGIPTIQAKTALAMQKAGGIMAWDLSQDSQNADLSLLSAIYSRSQQTP